ncbi:MAG TPA: TetR/AcrR family transcriptional regulator [Pyrinomonadaceae bacterium]|nr:TetR/AcrR family transcriptional regulator [Pyrinomonadaceae bacterium]
MRAIATREDIRDLILDATDRLLARYGYKKMTMEDLAQEVGIGKGTIYLHFPSKEEVVLSHVDRIVERLKGQLSTIARRETSPATRLREMLLARVLFRFDSVQHYTESLSDLLAALRPGLLTRRRRHFEEESQIIADVLREGRREGLFELRDAASTARTMLTATNALLPYSLSARELGKREDVAVETARVVDLLLYGLLKPDAKAKRS